MLTFRPLAKHVVQAAVTDVVGPAVATEDPHALLHQHVGESQQVDNSVLFGSVRLGEQVRQLLPQVFNALALGFDARLIGLVGIEKLGHQPIAELRGQLPQQFASVFGLLVDRQPHAQTKLGIVLKQ